MGCQTWPDDAEFETCPICEEPTKRYRNVTPLTRNEALSVKRHHQFEVYYREQHTPDLTPLTDDDLKEMGIPIRHPFGRVPRAQNGGSLSPSAITPLRRQNRRQRA